MSDVELYQTPTANLIAWAEAGDAAYQLAQRIAATSIAPEQFRGKPAEAAVAIITGAEVGLSPMQSLQSTYIIGGRAAFYTRAMVALVMQRGHEVWTKQQSPKSVTVCGRRAASEHVEEVTVTMEQAHRAGWTKNRKYETEPMTMLYWRAASSICRKIAPDALLGIPYSAEELTDEDAAPEPKRTVRRAVKPQVPDAPAIEPPAASESEADPAPQEPTQDTLTGDDDA